MLNDEPGFRQWLNHVQQDSSRLGRSFRALRRYKQETTRRKERKALVVDERPDPAEQCHVAMTAREPTDPYTDMRDQKENRAPWVPLPESSARAAHMHRAESQERCAAVGSVETYTALRKSRPHGPSTTLARAFVALLVAVRTA